MDYTKEQFIYEFHRVAMAIKESRLLFNISTLLGGDMVSPYGYGADCGIQLICERFHIPFSDYITITLCDFVDDDDQWEIHFDKKAGALYDEIVKEINDGSIV